MEIPFTSAQFLDIFRAYNQAIAPFQLVAYLLGLWVVWFLLRPSPPGNRVIGSVLAVYWVGMGAGYHLLWFSAINPAAVLFGIAFILQGLLFLYAGLLKNRLRFAGPKPASDLIGWIFILYAMLGYPLLNLLTGHHYPAMPVFGVAPCPTTIFTFGVLLLVRSRVPLYLIVIPFLWALIGVSAAIQLGIWEDLGLVIAGVTGAMLVIHFNRQKTDEPGTRI